jgi:hypothetical protein
MIAFNKISVKTLFAGLRMPQNSSQISSLEMNFSGKHGPGV